MILIEPLAGPAEWDDLFGEDLRRVPFLAGVTLPATIFDTPLNVDPLALLELAFDHPHELVPGDDPVPLGSLPCPTSAVGPTAPRRQ
jgi:hypothetical protein